LPAAIRRAREWRSYLVDDDPGRRRIAHNSQQGNRRVVATALVDGGFAALGDEIENDISTGSVLAGELEPAIAA
jgi:hypothetical protein